MLKKVILSALKRKERFREKYGQGKALPRNDK